ncbi:zuotin [Trichomonascus vanleenenianus]|uniref:zuotin n=1 Tax=Trichomonascus vanleenenianus TaxID=2268995 RepID=UPI003ECB18C0
MSLPALPSDWTAPESFAAYAPFSSPVKRSVEPVGPGFLAHARRTLRGRTWSEDERIQAEQNVKKVESNGDEDILEDEPEDPDMLLQDPKQWKEQDHYAVLGLSKHRYKATEEQIRIGHRRKVLKHHPDKKAAAGVDEEEADNFFKCIQKAFELLLDPVKRRQFDSVDKKADVPPPSKKAKGDFIELWAPVFEAEARFSNITPVPMLGTMESSKEEVDKFYAFWYNFDSWRSFEYLDEDVPDDTSNRDNKRYVEKKNKNARTKRKTEDTARLRKLVDDCMSVDPRIKMFKEAERKAKEQRKWEREAGARAAAEAERKAKEEAERKKAEEEASAKAAKESSKKNKEAAKNAKKKNKRTIRNAAKEAYGEDDAANADVGTVIDKLDDVTLGELADKVGDTAATKAAIEETVTSLLEQGKLTEAALLFFKK